VFTGIVERVGRVVAVRPADAESGAPAALEIAVGPDFGRELAIGASVCVDGCCLTVVERSPGTLRFEAVPETLACTSLGDKRVGSRVNLERALPAGGRFDGHVVQGHVDGCGTVRALHRDSADVRIEIECEAPLRRYLVPKGSVAVAGVSLTVASVESHGFSVALIPHTLAETTLSDLQIGERVNLEADVLGKYVHHYLNQRLP